MACEYLCVNVENGCFGYDNTPEQAFEDMLKVSGDDAHDINPDFIQFWQGTDLRVMVETKIVVKTSTGG